MKQVKDTISKVVPLTILSVFLLFISFLLSEKVYAGTYTGPTGIVFTDHQNTVGGGGITDDVTFVANTSFTACSSLNGSVNGAAAVTNGSTVGIVDVISGAGGATGQFIKDGDWAVFQQTPGVGCVYPGPSLKGEFTITSGSIVVPSSVSRIDTLTYATSTRIANITGYINATTTPYVFEELEFWQNSVALGQESYTRWVATTTAGYEAGTTTTGSIDTYWLTAGAFDIDVEFLGLPTPYSSGTTTAPFVSPYTLNAVLSQSYGDFNPFTGEGTPSEILDEEHVTVSTLTYNLPDYTTGAGLAEYPEYECSISSITGCLKNAGIWLFYPASDSIEKFKSLNTTLAGKFPFSYAYQAPTLVNKLWTTTQTASSTIAVTVPNFGSITFLSSGLMSAVPYANTIKTIIGWILWIMTVEFIYYRVIRSHDPHTPQ